MVEETLAGRADSIKEYSLAQDVFQRGIDFDPKESSIVRVEANRLRQRLEQYYLDSPHDDVRIEIPKGSYVPVFRYRQNGEAVDNANRLDVAHEYFNGLSKDRIRQYNTRIIAVLALEIVSPASHRDDTDVLVDIEESDLFRTILKEPITSNSGVIRGFYEGCLLALFDSAETALSAAIAVQQLVKDRNSALQRTEIAFAKVGLDINEVHDWGGIPWGPAVEEASAMADLAGRNGIRLTGSVHEQLNRRPSIEISFAGYQVSKNRARRYRTYQVQLRDTAKSSVPHPERIRAKWDSNTPKPDIGTPRKRPGILTWTSVGAVALMLIYGVYHMTVEMPRIAQGSQATSSGTATGVITEKTTLAVFPFNAGGTDEIAQETAEELSVATIVNLTQDRGLSVVSHGATHQYRGREMDMRQFGTELEVDYVLAGQIKVADDAIDIVAELIDVETGANIWSESVTVESPDEESTDTRVEFIAGFLASNVHDVLIESAR
ncbi:MAG: hypothetical protein AAF999_07775 [Pseudomonadota bacterium]